ncbi:hypothetical protein TNCV_4618011 [Trichonephila clavipes]|nr:hypothetical protein TNCV_4618011 [Trichonephila clavipes]
MFTSTDLYYFEEKLKEHEASLSQTLATLARKREAQKRLEKPLDTQVPEGFERVSSSTDGCHGTFSLGTRWSVNLKTRPKAPLPFVLPGDAQSPLKQELERQLLATR